jgi:hypothetical protein
MERFIIKDSNNNNVATFVSTGSAETLNTPYQRKVGSKRSYNGRSWRLVGIYDSAASPIERMYSAGCIAVSTGELVDDDSTSYDDARHEAYAEFDQK